MRLGDYADAVKRSLTAVQVAKAIGLNPDRNGFCKCPLHGEKTGSMKLYPGTRGWYCFGCHQGGSVIDLVMSYYGMDLLGAIEFLNSEFQLGLPIGYKPTKEQEAEAKRRAEAREAEERKRKEKEAERDRAYRRYIDLSREIADAENDIREFAPKKFDDDFDVRYINAVEKIDRLREEAKDLELVIYEKGEER